jgi:hypothetical protein
MKRILITLGLVVCIVGLAKAQEYKTTHGIRAGLSSGLTINHFKKYSILISKPKFCYL